MASSSTSSPLSSPPMSPSPTPSSTHYSLQNPRTHDVFQSIVKGRKSWKTFRGGEVVWPPELEAALIEGLENYQPDDSRETRLLGRFPLRNRFISDWIYEKTGKRRSAKQVGSRLQQLRDTCGAKRIRNLLLHPRHISPDVHHKHGTRPTRCESDSGSDSSASAPATPIEAHATLQSLLYRGIEPREELPNNIVYIDLLRPGSSLNVDDQSWTSPSQAAEERSLVERGHNIVRATQHPRLFSDIDPTVTLLAHSRTNARCYFAVHSDNRLIYSESTTLERVDPPTTSNVDGVLYKTSLVPGFWDTISQSSDASQYTIIQRVVQESSSSSSSSTPSTIFSAMYKFIYQTSTPTVENFTMAQLLTAEPFVQTDEFSLESLESLLSMDPDSYSDIMGFTKSADFFDIDFAMAADWSGQCSPSHSVFSSPYHYPQLIPNHGMPDEDVQLLSPASSFGIDIPNYP